MARRLRLNRESLTELVTDELALIVGAGGGPEPTPPVYALTYQNCPPIALTRDCPTNLCVPITYYCDTATC